MLGKDKLNTIEILISKALINSYISHHELISVNNVLREYNEMKEEIKNYVEKNILQTKNSVVRETKHNKLMLLSNFVVCGK